MKLNVPPKCFQNLCNPKKWSLHHVIRKGADKPQKPSLKTKTNQRKKNKQIFYWIKEIASLAWINCNKDLLLLTAFLKLCCSWNVYGNKIIHSLIEPSNGGLTNGAQAFTSGIQWLSWLSFVCHNNFKFSLIVKPLNICHLFLLLFKCYKDHSSQERSEAGIFQKLWPHIMTDTKASFSAGMALSNMYSGLIFRVKFWENEL